MARRSRLASADAESAQSLAAQLGSTAVVAIDNHDALRGASDVILALRFTALQSVIDEIADSLADKLVVVPSNPLGTDAQGISYRSWRTASFLATLWPVGCRPRSLGHDVWDHVGHFLAASSNRAPERAVLFYVSMTRRPANKSSG